MLALRSSAARASSSVPGVRDVLRPGRAVGVASEVMPPWCPGSDIRIPSRQVRLRMSEPKGHQQTLDSSVVLDLTFASRTRSDTEANVKSTTLETIEPKRPAIAGLFLRSEVACGFRRSLATRFARICLLTQLCPSRRNKQVPVSYTPVSLAASALSPASIP